MGSFFSKGKMSEKVKNKINSEKRTEITNKYEKSINELRKKIETDTGFLTTDDIQTYLKENFEQLKKNEIFLDIGKYEDNIKQKKGREITEQERKEYEYFQNKYYDILYSTVKLNEPLNPELFKFINDYEDGYKLITQDIIESTKKIFENEKINFSENSKNLDENFDKLSKKLNAENLTPENKIKALNESLNYITNTILLDNLQKNNIIIGHEVNKIIKTRKIIAVGVATIVVASVISAVILIKHFINQSETISPANTTTKPPSNTTKPPANTTTTKTPANTTTKPPTNSDSLNKDIMYILSLVTLKISGCYMIRNNGVNIEAIRLEGCSNWYNNIENQFFCGCPETTENKELPDCSKKELCNYPFCIKQNSNCNIPDAEICTIPNSKEKLYKCNGTSINDKDFVFYTYQFYTPNSVVDIINSLAEEDNNTTSNIFTIVITVIGIVLTILVIYFIMKNKVSKKKLRK